jgi:hypothetical protein
MKHSRLPLLPLSLLSPTLPHAPASLLRIGPPAAI